MSVCSLTTRKLLSRSFLSFPQIATFSRQLSFNEAVEKRNHLFTLEKKHQNESVGRIEKIEVKYMGTPKDCTMIMNKEISTPFDCARHLSISHMERCALAVINGNVVWDMNRPIPDSCTLELLDFLSPLPQQVNLAFWRTCSFVLGATIARAFRDKYKIKLHSFPSPDIRSGSFVYDAELCGLDEWKPTQEEYRVFSTEMIKFVQSAVPIERLTVPMNLALAMFEENEHKSQQIPHIARKNAGNVTLYRAGTHIDISKGPMISNVRQIGRVTIPAVFNFTGQVDDRKITLHRFQGVALPIGIIINHVAYGLLEKRAKKLNPARSPLTPYDLEYVDNHAAEAIA